MLIRVGKQQPLLNLYIFNVRCFWSIIHEKCIFLAPFSWIRMFRFKPANKKLNFIELTCFESFVNDVPSFYFGWKPPVARNAFLQKRLWKSWYYKCKICSICILQAISLLSKKSSWPQLHMHFLYLHASVNHAHVLSKRNSDFARHRLPK